MDTFVRTGVTHTQKSLSAASHLPEKAVARLGQWRPERARSERVVLLKQMVGPLNDRARMLLWSSSGQCHN